MLITLLTLILEFGGVVCVSLGVVGADGTQSGFRGVGGTGGAGGKLTYGMGISYNIIMRCNSASLSTRKVDYEKEIPDAFHEREHERSPSPHTVVSTDLLRCSHAMGRGRVGAVRSGL
jgi:hypothetical protein